jgi:hypothetical protein
MQWPILRSVQQCLFTWHVQKKLLLLLLSLTLGTMSVLFQAGLPAVHGARA